MKLQRAFLTLLCCSMLIALAGCSGGSTSNTGTTSDTPATTSAGEMALPDVEIPTQEEADAMAAREISADNADAEYEALMREIESEAEE